MKLSSQIETGPMFVTEAAAGTTGRNAGPDFDCEDATVASNAEELP